MAKSLLLNALVRVLGDYVNGLTEENLKVGVWSGKIVLNSLELNHNILYRLNLPVDVFQGTAKTLEVIIPWGSLESCPIKVNIDGVFIQIGPLDISSFKPDDVRRRLSANKQYKLSRNDKLIDLFVQAQTRAAGTSPSNSTSYLQRLMGKIIDNIEISLSSIHVRYEDSLTIRGKTFAAGITLDTFCVVSTNNQWKETFVARDAHNEFEPIHKRANLNNVGMYWCTDCAPLAKLPPNEWKDAMQSMTYRDRDATPNPHVTTTEPSSLHHDKGKLPSTSATLPSASAVLSSVTTADIPAASTEFNADSLQYILYPINTLTVKFTHNEKTLDLKVPRVNLVIDSSTLDFSLDQYQHQQLALVLRSHKTLEKQQSLYSLRPVGMRPIRKGHCARMWWKYAYDMISGKLRNKSNVEMLYGNVRAV